MSNGALSPRAPGRRRRSIQAAPATRSKYGAQHCEIEHKGKVIKCASKAEAKRFGELILLEKVQKICGLRFHPRFPIAVRQQDICTYVGDAMYYDRDARTWAVEDIKGFETEVFKLKAKLFRASYAHELRIVKAWKGRGG